MPPNFRNRQRGRGGRRGRLTHMPVMFSSGQVPVAVRPRLERSGRVFSRNCRASAPPVRASPRRPHAPLPPKAPRDSPSMEKPRPEAVDTVRHPEWPRPSFEAASILSPFINPWRSRMNQISYRSLLKLTPLTHIV